MGEDGLRKCILVRLSSTVHDHVVVPRSTKVMHEYDAINLLSTFPHNVSLQLILLRMLETPQDVCHRGYP